MMFSLKAEMLAYMSCCANHMVSNHKSSNHRMHPPGGCKHPQCKCNSILEVIKSDSRSAASSPHAIIQELLLTDSLFPQQARPLHQALGAKEQSRLLPLQT